MVRLGCLCRGLSSRRAQTFGISRFLGVNGTHKRTDKSAVVCPLMDKYHDLVSRSQIKPDFRQQRLVAELARLLSKLHSTRSPKGVYIHGSVGTGKSMIFDLFFEAAKRNRNDAAAKRFHFHEFMLSIHKQIHEYKMLASNSEGAVSAVGRELVEKSGLRVLCLDEFQVLESMAYIPDTHICFCHTITTAMCSCSEKSNG